MRREIIMQFKEYEPALWSLSPDSHSGNSSILGTVASEKKKRKLVWIYLSIVY